MNGSLEVVVEEAGRGVPVWGYALGEVRVGSAPGAQRRGAMWVPLPRAGEKVERLYLSIGLLLPPDRRVPLRWKLSVDNVSIAREFKPQFAVETDRGVYYKAVYDVKPVLARRIVEREDHKVLIIHDALHPITVMDVFLFGVYGSERASYSVAYRTGAVALQPGEVYKADMNVGYSFGGQRKAGLIIHSPGADAEFEVVAGGSRPGIATGQGSHYVEVVVPYKGSPVPFSVKYRETPYTFYPKTAIVTEMVAGEIQAPTPRPMLVVEKARREGRTIIVEGHVDNQGDGDLENAQIVAIALGVPLARRRVQTIPAGGRLDFRLRLDASRLPLEPRRVSVRLIWRLLGRTRLEVVDLDLE